MKIIIIIALLIKIHYPSNDIETVRYYNQIVDDAFKNYCFLGIEFEYTVDGNKADINIYPKFNFYSYPQYIGFTNGNISQNPKFYGKTEILLSDALEKEDEVYVLTHEMAHALSPVGFHNVLDTTSLMYPSYNGRNKYLTRYDSLFLIDNFIQEYRVWHDQKK